MMGNYMVEQVSIKPRRRRTCVYWRGRKFVIHKPLDLSGWAMGEIEDLEMYHGMDIETELRNVLIQDIVHNNH